MAKGVTELPPCFSRYGIYHRWVAKRGYEIYQIRGGNIEPKSICSSIKFCSYSYQNHPLLRIMVYLIIEIVCLLFISPDITHFFSSLLYFSLLYFKKPSADVCTTCTNYYNIWRYSTTKIADAPDNKEEESVNRYYNTEVENNKDIVVKETRKHALHYRKICMLL